MLKRLTALMLALLALSAPSLAEVFEGTTAALASMTVASDVSGALESLEVLAGQRVEAGQLLATLASEKTFAAQDGTVSLLLANVGDAVCGEVLELAPVERYTIYCTVDKAYQSAASTLVHSGETLYVKCTADGTHRAVGVVTQIDGKEYRVLTVGGELYVGETVYLYRDADFTGAQRTGIGTVVASDTQAYEAEGALTLLRVAEGDYVERGQLLYATGGGAVVSPVSGIVASLSCQTGDAVEEGQAIAEIVPTDAVGVEIRVDETAVAKLPVGSAVALSFAGQEDGQPVRGTVVDISAIADSGEYVVRIRPEGDAALPLGMSVEVRNAGSGGTDDER